MIVMTAYRYHSYYDDSVVASVLDHNVMYWAMEVTNCYCVNQDRIHYFAHVAAVVVALNYEDFHYVLSSLSDKVVEAHRQMMMMMVVRIYKIIDDYFGIHYYVHQSTDLEMSPNYYCDGDGDDDDDGRHLSRA